MTLHEETIGRCRQWIAAEQAAWPAQFAIHATSEADLTAAKTRAAEARAAWQRAVATEDQSSFATSKAAAAEYRIAAMGICGGDQRVSMATKQLEDAASVAHARERSRHAQACVLAGVPRPDANYHVPGSKPLETPATRSGAIARPRRRIRATEPLERVWLAFWCESSGQMRVRCVSDAWQTLDACQTLAIAVVRCCGFRVRLILRQSHKRRFHDE